MNNKIGCLVLHGFGGDVKEVAPLASCLTDRGYKVLCPSLKGHTGRREDLQGVSYTDWIVSAEEGLLTLLSDCNVVYIIGFSMGGLLAINLGLKHNIGGIVTINTPIYYLNIKRAFIDSVNVLIRKDFKTMRRNIKASRALPFSSLLNFILLVKATKPQIKGLRCPVFITQAIDDPTVRKSSAHYIFRNARSPIKRLEFYDSSEHLILLSQEAELVIKDVIDFINSLLIL
ncbi:alpha/beta hydrolase [Desulfosporosinus metallidurans]|uniref:Carboxylesterase n=1 Tax=Desulfosporosinus metallidurans TaxID=1888891 RepID=A0A1Q8QWZ1_9FIRM|nr:alpha/beta fold hydrolase [Desulfosporosinus metallidurans]OLN31853.1 Carboxylesterase [Desulfosporosinus metallidurans]